MNKTTRIVPRVVVRLPNSTLSHRTGKRSPYNRCSNQRVQEQCQGWEDWRAKLVLVTPIGTVYIQEVITNNG
jgi:hypothetical protein